MSTFEASSPFSLMATSPKPASPARRRILPLFVMGILILSGGGYIFWNWSDLMLALAPSLTAEEQQQIAAELEPQGVKFVKDEQTGKIIEVEFTARRAINDEHLLKLSGFDSIVKLQVSDCAFTDEGFGVVRTMPELEELFAGGTAIGDAGLAALTHCPKLRVLYLDGCEEITPEGFAQLNKFPKLEYLSLNYCLFGEEGATALANHPSLRELYLTGGELLNKTAMTQIGSIPNLNVFSLYTSRIQDDEFAELRGAKNLQVLEIDYCSNLSDSSMKTISQLSKLQKLNIMGCQKITDEGLAIISGLTELQELNLYLSGTSQSCLKHLAQLQKLEQVRFNARDATDEDIKYLANFPHLQELQLPGAKVSDDGLQPLSGLTELQVITLGGNEIFTGAGLKHLSSAKEVKKIVLMKLPVENEAIKLLNQFPELNSLFLRDVLIDDRSVPDLSKLESLRLLHIHYTNMTSRGISRLKKALPQCEINYLPK
ncbi:MAG: hypothetical protein KDA65_05055 [Planctomycetaceae bacterium]|nr:hypothetical protein [Planctomycetaceae bacterium]